MFLNIGTNAAVLEDDSPYPEVRSAVANVDDPTMPASTIRAWVIGIVFAIVISVCIGFLTYFNCIHCVLIGLKPVLLFPLPVGYHRCRE